MVKKVSERASSHRDVPAELDLQSIRIFQDAASVTLTRLGMLARRKSFASGELLMRKGESADTVMFLLQGEVRVTVVSKDGREIGYRRIAAGEVVGDYAAIDERLRSADVIAVGDVQAALLSAREFVHLVAADPAVALAQMRSFVDMIRTLSERVLKLSALNAGERLADLLLNMAEPVNDEQACVRCLPTHAELAGLISSQRHVVTTELGKLEKQGLVQREGNDLRLNDLKRLRAIAGN